MLDNIYGFSSILEGLFSCLVKKISSASMYSVIAGMGIEVNGSFNTNKLIHLIKSHISKPFRIVWHGEL